MQLASNLSPHSSGAPATTGHKASFSAPAPAGPRAPPTPPARSTAGSPATSPGGVVLPQHPAIRRSIADLCGGFAPSEHFALELPSGHGGGSTAIPETVADALPEGCPTVEQLAQQPDNDIRFYREHFLDRDHMNFLALETPSGPVAVSIVLAPDGTAASRGPHYLCLVRTGRGSQQTTRGVAQIPVPFFRRLFGLGPSTDALLRGLVSTPLPAGALRLNRHPQLPRALISMEERQVIHNYKFGLLYARAGQDTEAELLANADPEYHTPTTPGAPAPLPVSEAYRQFLAWLGDRVTLKGWTGYRGGLDVVDNLTGRESVYALWQGYDIMFHVATMLPLIDQATGAGDQAAIAGGYVQQLERKRHIGNDIVVIVFQDADTLPGALPFNLDSVDSKQNHVFVSVTPVPRNPNDPPGTPDYYRVTLARKSGVPGFGPPLPIKVSRDADGRNWFLYKLISAERASYKAPSFAPKLARTRQVLLHDVVKTHM